MTNVNLDAKRQKGCKVKKPETKIVLLRSDSKGLPGTHENAHHHAEAILPFIERLEHAVGTLGFKLWRQGNNIHEFVNVEGTRYTLRAFTKDGEYVGVRLALRVSRSHEVRLIDVTNPNECWRLLDIMRLLAMPAKGDASGVMLRSQAA